MAGTMPHAVFVETDIGHGRAAAAYAAELPGCAVIAAGPDEAVAGIPRRVAAFVAWLRAAGEQAPSFVGDNWYEVERASAAGARAAFSLDELSPSPAEFASWTRWLELAREELAMALDERGAADPEGVVAITAQDWAFVADLGQPAGAAERNGDPIAALYDARDALTLALEGAGPGAPGVRRILRLAITDDLRLAEGLRSGAGAAAG